MIDELDIGPLDQRPLDVMPDEPPPLAPKPDTRITIEILWDSAMQPQSGFDWLLDIIEGIVKASGGAGVEKAYRVETGLRS